MWDEEQHAYLKHQLDLACAAYANKYVGLTIQWNDEDGDHNNIGGSGKAHQSMNKGTSDKGKEVVVSRETEEEDEKVNRRRHANKLSARRSRRRKVDCRNELQALVAELREGVSKINQELAQQEWELAVARSENRILKSQLGFI